MKTKIVITCLLLVISALVKADEDFQTGDIIFQTTNSPTNKAIELATHSKFSHVGVIVDDMGSLQVLEAGQTVRLTPLEKFINHGTGGNYAVLRLKTAAQLLTDNLKEELIAKGKSWIGKSYDYVFSWNDEELYCSELVYKLYDFVLDIQLAQPRPLKTFDLSNPLVKDQLKVKYGDNIPYNDNMVSPQQIFESDLLIPITKNTW